MKDFLNYTADGTPADMNTWKWVNQGKRKSDDGWTEEMRLRKYEVIIMQFDALVDWMKNGKVPVDERHSELRIY